VVVVVGSALIMHIRQHPVSGSGIRQATSGNIRYPESGKFDIRYIPKTYTCSWRRTISISVWKMVCYVSCSEK